MRPVRTTALATSAALVCCASAGADPERALLRQSELRAGWEVVNEVPVDPASDADLRGWGVREQVARHYTRALPGRAEVCSVEIWAFDSEAQAESAHQGFTYPDWQIDREGRLLVMARGLVLERGSGTRRGVFPECEALAHRVRERAAGL